VNDDTVEPLLSPARNTQTTFPVVGLAGSVIVSAALPVDPAGLPCTFVNPIYL
jgi:hypothetical protein